jgi:hypothetical protein
VYLFRLRSFLISHEMKIGDPSVVDIFRFYFPPMGVVYALNTFFSDFLYIVSAIY